MDPDFDDTESMLHYCEEFVSSSALRSLKEAVQGCDMKQPYDMGKMVREVSKNVNIHRNTNSELDSVDLVNQVIFEDKNATKLYMDHPNVPQTEQGNFFRSIWMMRRFE